MRARYAPVDLKVDLRKLPKSEKQALATLVEAAKITDTLFLRQQWGGNLSLLASLARATSPLARAQLDYFWINKGPWSRLDEYRPFIAGVPAHPPAGTFYPADASREEVEKWLSILPSPQSRLARGFYTTIRRAADGKLRYVWYSIQYQSELERLASLLREAAAASEQPSLKRYLDKRATALLTNDYYESDLAWMELDASIEPTIGAYEVYGDGWFAAKAAFEAFVTLRDDLETRRLAELSGRLQELEDNLPQHAALGASELGPMAPIRVVNAVLLAGDAMAGEPTAAFNLPNDERIAQEKGTKRVLLKNIQKAKFDKVVTPIAALALAPAHRRQVSFDAFFTHMLMHELVHGLGPRHLNVDNKATTVRQALAEAYAPLEEAKADVGGLWAMQYLIDHDGLPRSLEQSMYVTCVASALRSVRFGVHEPHGRSMAMLLNHLVDAGAVTIKGGRLSVRGQEAKEAVAGLFAEILVVQAKGDKAGAQALLAKGELQPQVEAVLNRLTHVPVDIAPRFSTAEKLLAQRP